MPTISHPIANWREAYVAYVLRQDLCQKWVCLAYCSIEMKAFPLVSSRADTYFGVAFWQERNIWNLGFHPPPCFFKTWPYYTVKLLISKFTVSLLIYQSGFCCCC